MAHRKAGKLIEEEAGRQLQDDMTAARAAALRSSKINGGLPSNREHRQIEKAQRSQDQESWTIGKPWDECKANRPHLRDEALRRASDLAGKLIDQALNAAEKEKATRLL